MAETLVPAPAASEAGRPGAQPSGPGAKWAVPGRAPIDIPTDPWEADALDKLRGHLARVAASAGVDLTADPRSLLTEPDLCK
eukprot:4257895-Pyramimonas_sp.AAC.1